MEKYLTVFRSEHGKHLVIEAYDKIVNSIGIQYEDIYIPTRLGETHVISTGIDQNPPLILIHAYYASAASWYKNLRQLSEHYKVYNIDIIGDPNKSKPVKLIRQLEDFIYWFDDLMEGLKLKNASFIGNSVGAFHIMNYYLHSPERVKKMILIGPAATFQQIMPFYFHTFPGGMTGWSPMVKHAVKWIENGVSFDKDFNNLFFLLLKYGKATNQVFPAVFSDEDLERVDIPTLLIYGDRENIYNYSLAVERAKLHIKNLTVRVIKDGNHITAATNSLSVNSEIIEFLETK